MTTDPSPVASSSSYAAPSKRIVTQSHLSAFQSSETHGELLGFIDELNEAIVNVKLTEHCPISDVSPHDGPFDPRNSRLLTVSIVYVQCRRLSLLLCR